MGSMQQAQAAITALNSVPFSAAGPLAVKFADADAGERNPLLAAPPSNNLYCRNLPVEYTADDLRQMFAPYGTVLDCRLLQRTESQVPGLRMGQGAARML